MSCSDEVFGTGSFTTPWGEVKVLVHKENKVSFPAVKLTFGKKEYWFEATFFRPRGMKNGDWKQTESGPLWRDEHERKSKFLAPERVWEDVEEDFLLALGAWATENNALIVEAEKKYRQYRIERTERDIVYYRNQVRTNIRRLRRLREGDDPDLYRE